MVHLSRLPKGGGGAMSQAFIKALRRSIRFFNDTLAAHLKLRENRDPLGPPRHQVGFRL